MKIVTVEEMRDIEQRADEAGHSYAEMMENAGRAVAEAIGDLEPVRDRRVLILIGPGNNGGDGLVAGRYLHDKGARVTFYVWKREVQGDVNLSLVQGQGIPILWQAEDTGELDGLRGQVREADVVVDSLLGTGVSRPIRGGLKQTLQVLREEIAARRGDVEMAPLRHVSGPSAGRVSRVPLIVAVDVPTGLNCDTGEVDPVALIADLTVTFGFPKRGQFLFPGAAHVGELVVADIGIPDSLASGIPLRLATPELVRSILPERPLSAHKGTFGKALVVAGSVNYTGAAYLASAAATRVGTGLVTLALAESLHPILASKLTEVTFLLLPHYMGALVPEACNVLERDLARYSALLVGPGLGRDPKTDQFVIRLLGGKAIARPRLGFVASEERKAPEAELPPVVVDADGCNALATVPGWWKRLRSPSVLTPHPGEMSRLLGCSVAEVEADRIEVARTAAREWGQVVLLKGAFTVIAEPGGEVTVNPFANAGLASAGTGDVLAGSVVGFLAQGLSPYEAAVAGAYVHGLAGQRARTTLGEAGMAAGDLLTTLPYAMMELQKP